MYVQQLRIALQQVLTSILRGRLTNNRSIVDQLINWIKERESDRKWALQYQQQVNVYSLIFVGDWCYLLEIKCCKQGFNDHIVYFLVLLSRTLIVFTTATLLKRS